MTEAYRCSIDGLSIARLTRMQLPSSITSIPASRAARLAPVSSAPRLHPNIFDSCRDRLLDDLACDDWWSDNRQRLWGLRKFRNRGISRLSFYIFWPRDSTDKRLVPKLSKHETPCSRTWICLGMRLQPRMIFAARNVLMVLMSASKNRGKGTAGDRRRNSSSSHWNEFPVVRTFFVTNCLLSHHHEAKHRFGNYWETEGTYISSQNCMDGRSEKTICSREQFLVQ